MSKELTPLEALEIIKHTTDIYMPNELNGYKEEIDIIETALKDLEETNSKLDNLFESLGIESKEDLINRLKALEIMKKKEVLFKGLNETTQEEYELLKEVLL